MTIETTILSAIGGAIAAAVGALWREHVRANALAIERERAATVALTRAADALEDTEHALNERTCPACDKPLVGRRASRTPTGEHARATMAPEVPR